MSIVSGIMGAGASKSAANTAADAQTNATAMGVEAQLEMFNQAVETLRPFVESGYRGLAAYEAAPSGVSAQISLPSTDIAEPGLPVSPGADIDLPKTPGAELGLPETPGAELDFTFDPNDPNYLIRKEDLERDINRSLAQRGSYNSRMGVNLLADQNRRLSANELDRQYGRAVDRYGRRVDEYGRQYGQATDKYGVRVDEYGRQYGAATDQYGRRVDKYNRDYSAGLDKYGRDVDKYGREYTTAAAKWESINQLRQQELNKQFALANIGRGTSTAQGNLGAQAGSGIRSAYQSQGNQLANIYGREGNQLSNIYGNIAPNTIGSAYYGVKAYNAYTANQNNLKYYQFAAGKYGAGGGSSGYGNWAGGTIS